MKPNKELVAEAYDLWRRESGVLPSLTSEEKSLKSFDNALVIALEYDEATIRQALAMYMSWKRKGVDVLKSKKKKNSRPNKPKGGSDIT